MPQLPRALERRLLLLLTELVNNAVLHGAGAGEVIGVKVIASPSMVRLSVTDDGPSYRYSGQAPLEEPGTWALQIVDQMSDRWGVAHSEKTTVWLEIDRDPPRGGRFNARGAGGG